MSTNKIEQVIEFMFKGGSKAENALGRLETSFKNLSKAAGVNTKEVNKNNDALNKLSEQGMFNIQAGMVQLSTYSMIMNQKVNNAFDKMQNSFKKAENSLTQLKIKMGMTLSTAQGSEITNEFKEMETEIKRLAATTKFTIPEVADAFNKLVGTGLKAKEAIKALVPTLKFVSASAGAIDLSQGVEAAKLSTTTLNGTLEDLDQNLNDIFSATQQTSLSFENVTETFTGLKSSFASFKKDKDLPLALVGLSSAMASVGMVGREGGDKINQFAGALNNMFKLTEKGEFMGFDRRNVNRKNMLRFFGFSDVAGNLPTKIIPKMINSSKGPIRKALIKMRKDLFDVDKSGKKFTKKANIADFLDMNKDTSKLDDNVRLGIERLRDLMMKDLLTEKGTGGKRGLKGATDLMNTILGAYKNAVDKEGKGVVSAYVSSALGGAKGTKLVLQALKKQMEASGAKSFADYLDVLRARGDKLGEANKMALDTVEGQTALLESAYDSMFQSLMGKDVFGKEALKVHRDLISTLDVMLKKYPSLAQAVVGMGRAFQVFTGIATNLGFALTAMATLSMGLTYASKATGRGMKGLGNILGSFRTIFLAPTLSVLMSLVGGFALAGVALVALMKHFTGAKTIGEGFSKTMDTISVKVKGITGLFKLSMNENFAGKSAKQIAEEYKKAVEDLVLFKGSIQNVKKMSEEQIKTQTELTGRVNMFREAMGGDDVFKKFKDNTDTSLMSLAGIADKLLELKGTLMGLLNGLITGLTPFIGGIVYFMEKMGQVLTFIFRMVTSLFGYLGDSEGNTAAWAVGWMLGSFLGIKIVLMTMSGLITTLIGGFVGMGNAISRAKGFMADFNNIAEKPITTQTYGYTYKDVKKNRAMGLPIGGAVPNMSFPTRQAAHDALYDKNNKLTNRRRMEISMIAGPSHKATGLERMALRYNKLMGNAEAYDRVLERARVRVSQTNTTLAAQASLWDKIKGKATSVSGAIRANKGVMAGYIGTGLGLLGTASMFSSFFGEEVAGVLDKVGLIAIALGSLWPLIGSLVVGFVALTWPILLVAGVASAIYYWWEDILSLIKKVGGFIASFFGKGGTVDISPKSNKSTKVHSTSTKQKVIQNNTVNQDININTTGDKVAENIGESLRSSAPNFQPSKLEFMF